MAQAYALLPYYSGASANEASAKAKSVAEQALRLDDTLVDAHATLGIVEVGRFNWPAAGLEYQRALQLNPNQATARQWYSFYLWLTNHHHEALGELDHARQLDPLSQIINTDESRLLCAAGQTDGAIALLQKTIGFDPNFADAHRALALAYIQKGQNPQAIIEASRGVALDPNDYEKASLGYVYGKAGEAERARKILAEFSHRSSGQRVSPVYLSFIYVGLGEKDQAFARLEEAYRERSSLLNLVQFEVIFDTVRSDPRFLDLCHRLSEVKAE